MHRASARGLLCALSLASVAAAGLVVPATAGATALSPSKYVSWGLPGELLNARGVAAGPKGNVVYVADHGHDRIVQYTAGGAFIRTWGGQGSAEGEFDGPSAVATDELGRVYVADSGNGRIQKFSASGEFLQEWSSPAAIDVATDGDGHVFTLSALLGIVAERTYGGSSVTAWPSPFPGQYFFSAGYEEPTSDTVAIAAEPSGEVVAAGHSSQALSNPEPDCHNVTDVNPSLDHHPYPDPLVTGEVVRFNSLGEVLESGWLSPSPVDCTQGWFSYGDPTDVAVDPNGGRVYVSLEEHFIQMLPPDLDYPYAYSGTYGDHLGLPCGVCDGLPQNFTTPTALTFDCRSNLYVTTSTRVLKYLSPPGTPASTCEKGGLPFELVIERRLTVSESGTELDLAIGCAVARCIGEIEVRQVRSSQCPPRCPELAHGTVDIDGSARSEVAVRLDQQAQRLLERESRLPIEVTFTFRGREDQTVRRRTVLRDPSSLTLDCGTSGAAAIELATGGELDPAAGRDRVELIYLPPTGDAIRRSARTDGSGRYGASLTATQAGTWMIEASWRGDRTHQPTAADPCVVEVDPLASSLVIECPVAGVAGEPLRIAGELAAPHDRTRIAIDYFSPSGRLVSRVGMTGADGAFVDGFTPPDAGTWTIRARWPGDADHAGASSIECRVDVARARSA